MKPIAPPAPTSPAAPTTTGGAEPLLRVEHLSTRFRTRGGEVAAVDDLSFELATGEVLGLVGESGCGKSMTGYSLIDLVDPPGYIAAGSVRLRGHELRGLPAKDWQALRGDRIAMIFQDPMLTLNPVLRIDTQMVETVLAHRRVGRAEALARALDTLERVGIPAAAERLRSYPHQLSGGMRQRVAIAIALLNQPDLIIADEPTTALDVTIQAQILYEMQTLCREAGTGLIWITHDLSVVAGLADRLCVMYAGRIVEQGSTAQVLERPAHPYTRGLLDATPAAALARGHRRGEALRQIPGSAPPLAALPAGCAFRPRCARADEHCMQTPPRVEAAPGQTVLCWHPLPPGAALPGPAAHAEARP
ncbi:ABC transporter ATP-binding protein [Thauera linaloolentis]|uniref:Dipeptide ABC transporter ATP-binding protein n=1 Tax=Thauera linaloolentis (strain DSM 12138 / JCM 21573 / CCUG 41526 / CIP 105981 / IAM 15112 / NBRC 102519 / 47Lol) TaxID=1123367 RepID=N6Y669_THAL4|nr:ABC transporter ATP-binding protein [Thauera linaloolentis]ENO87090.1 dipeptide ABC transporter ATP-binding protein [Thauera linaloolentis 47Lol = DSM 12138]MCM8565511.1 ABC transporter ATP-binding protein [Thauera linaloolentis]